MKKSKKIYLDYNATTPMDPGVLEAMIPYFTEKFGNPASHTHSFGWEAEEAVSNVRTTIAKELNANSREIIFTSGATESLNLAIKGLCQSYSDEKKNHIITSVIEHRAVLDTCKEMDKRSWKITCLPVEKDGLINLQSLEKALRDDTLLVVLMHANNEIGTINPIKEIGMTCKKRGVFFAVDAAQSFGKLPINVQEMGIDLLAVSGHKIYGPKGIGFLYVRMKNPQVRLKAQIDGGGQEQGLRSGTLAVPLIVGLGKATELCIKERKTENPRLETLRNKLFKGICDVFPDTILNGSLESRLPNNLNICFPNIEGEALVMSLSDIACSTGSACTRTAFKPSHVISALGVNDELARSAVRFSLGRFTSEEEINIALEQIINGVERLRQLRLK